MRRLLFVRRSRNPRRAPSYVALVALAALGLIGLGVPSRPQEPAAATSKPVEGAPPAGKAHDGGQHIALPVPAPGPRSRWM